MDLGHLKKCPRLIHSHLSLSSPLNQKLLWVNISKSVSHTSSSQYRKKTSIRYWMIYERDKYYWSHLNNQRKREIKFISSFLSIGFTLKKEKFRPWLLIGEYQS